MPEPFFKDGEGDDAATTAVELRNRIVRLEQQVLAEYTSMAAYATIAKQDVETARAEARSDLDRSQATVIGLIEKLRNEVNARLDGIVIREAGGDPPDGVSMRLTQLETRLHNTTEALNECLRENQELRSQVAELVEQRMQQQGWLVSSGTTEALSLH